MAELVAELRFREGVAEMVHGLPHRYVEEHAATGDAAMQLSGDVARLALEILRIIGPRGEELVNLISGDVELVHQQHRSAGVLQLLSKTHVAIHFGQLDHDQTLPS